MALDPRTIVTSLVGPVYDFTANGTLVSSLQAVSADLAKSIGEGKGVVWAGNPNSTMTHNYRSPTEVSGQVKSPLPPLMPLLMPLQPLHSLPDLPPLSSSSLHPGADPTFPWHLWMDQVPGR